MGDTRNAVGNQTLFFPHILRIGRLPVEYQKETDRHVPDYNEIQFRALNTKITSFSRTIRVNDDKDTYEQTYALTDI